MNLKHLGISAVSVAILAAVTPSFAGYNIGNVNVTVDETGMSATGGMGAAYSQWLSATGTSQPYIACITIYVTGQADVFCYAKDGSAANNGAGNAASCEYGGTTFDAFGKTAQVATQDAYISFNWNSGGWCTELVVEPISALPPK